MSVFVDQIPPGAPVLVVLVEQDGCPACEEYHPVFEQAAAPYAKDGLPIFRLDANSLDSDALAFMTKHGVESTPTVIVASLHRGPIAKIEGNASLIETRHLLDVARAHNRNRSW
jgi:thiol-disulfide isomerase/thioredoxin